MAFREVLICEKHKQAKMFKKGFSLNETKVIRGVGVAYYNSTSSICCVYESGHVFGLVPPEKIQPELARDRKGWDPSLLPVIPEGTRWPLEGVVDSRPKEQKRLNAIIDGIKWALVDQGKPGTIYLAVDNDREGDLLGWEVLEKYNLIEHPDIRRCLYSRITQKAMLAAYKKAQPAKPKFYQTYLAGQGRRNGDWACGMNMTMGITAVNRRFLPRYTVLNSGRVVWAISYLLYCRQKDIDNFVPKDYYNEDVFFEHAPNESFRTSLIVPKEWLDPDGKFIDKAKAEKVHHYVQKVGKGKVASCDKQKKATPPPIGFDRNDFDRHMIRRHRLDMKQIASAMQVLYSDLGLITYPRVDFKYLDVDMHADMPAYIDAMLSNLMSASAIEDATKARYKKVAEYIDASRRSNIWKEGVDDNESHHAIIPTDVKYNQMDSLTPHQLLVYKELSERLLAQFLPDYEYYSTIVSLEVGQFVCRASGTTPARAGWKGLTVDTEEEKDDEDQGASVPVLEPGKVLKISNAKLKALTTECPKPYTTDELLGHMKNPRPFVKNKELLKGLKNVEIGTSATREPHITSLETKRLVTMQKDKKVVRMIPTRRLMKLMEIAPDYLKLPETSAYWEDALQRIEKNTFTLGKFMDQQRQLLARFTKDLHAGKFTLTEPVDDYLPCEKECDGFLFLTRPKGKNYTLWSCNRCDKAYFDDNGSKGSPFGRTAGGKSGAGAAWTPSANTPSKPCPGCKKSKVYLKTIPGRKFKLWSCLECNRSYFDDKGSIGKELKSKK